MALCGYNNEIGIGLNKLIEGMILSIEEKAAKAGKIEAIDQELYELDEMIDGLENKGPAQELFAGINIFAKKFFTEVKRELTSDPERSIKFIMEDLGRRFILTQYRAFLHNCIVGDVSEEAMAKAHGYLGHLVSVYGWPASHMPSCLKKVVQLFRDNHKFKKATYLPET